MKKAIYGLMLSCLCIGCNESKFLKEVPEDFMSPENSFITENDFNMSVNDLYERNRREFYGSDESKPFDYIYGTDLIVKKKCAIPKHDTFFSFMFYSFLDV